MVFTGVQSSEAALLTRSTFFSSRPRIGPKALSGPQSLERLLEWDPLRAFLERVLGSGASCRGQLLKEPLDPSQDFDASLEQVNNDPPPSSGQALSQRRRIGHVTSPDAR